jgi:AcrR family transcriptional regulator
MADAHRLGGSCPAISEGGAMTGAPLSDTAKRQQIMEGARRVFLENGFDGASIGDIVRAAGVSKGTLYAYFPSKEKLFETLVFEDRRKQGEALFLLDEGDQDIGRVLFKLGVSFVDMLVQPETLAFQRIVIAAAGRFPEIGHTYYEAGPVYGTARLAAYLRHLVSKGALVIDDAELAARQFLDLCKTGIHLRMMLGHAEPPSRDEVSHNVQQAITVFLAAYGSHKHSQE